MLTEFEVIILAAGEARRFGSPKQLARWQGQPLLQHAIQLTLDLGFKPWLVLGAHRSQILSDGGVDAGACHVVCAENWHQGLSFSIKAALRQVMIEKPQLKGVVFLLADQPLLSTNDLKSLFHVIQENDAKIVCSKYHNSMGVPAYFPCRYIDDLLVLEGDKGAKSLIEMHPHIAVPLNTSLVDIDVPEDLMSLLQNG